VLPDLAFGAVELEKTDCPPWRVVPAVAPRSRAASCCVGAVLLTGALVVPLPWLLERRVVPVDRLGVPLDRLGPVDRLGVPLDCWPAPLVVDEALEPEVLEAELPAPAPLVPVAGAAALAGGAAAWAPAGAVAGGAGGAVVAPPPAPAGGAAWAAGGAGGEEGVPKPGAVHAQAMLAPATATPRTDRTAKQAMRTCLCITPSPNLLYEHRT